MKYVTAGLATVAAVLLRYSVNPLFHDQSRFLLLLPIMILWARYAGLWAGVLVVGLGSVLTELIVSRPYRTPDSMSSEATSFIAHLLLSAGFLWLVKREVTEKRERRSVEEKLAQMNHELEEKVRLRTAELKAANAELENFCHSIAHDLRTPTRAISGNANILLEDYAESLPADLKFRLERMSRGATKLGVLVDALLLYARLAQQDLTIVDVDFSSIAEEAARVEGRAARVEVDLDVEDGLFVLGDERLIRVLIYDLVKNSVLYRQSGERASVSVRRSGDAIVFADKGIGFDMAYKSKVFLPFERLHRDEAYLGVGMGLANVARIVERHEGTVDIESAPNRGTRVTLWLPGLTKRACPKNSSDRCPDSNGVLPLHRGEYAMNNLS